MAAPSNQSKEHENYRAYLISTWTPGDLCARCEQPMWHKDQLQLGHTDDGRAYTGLEHRHCNLDAELRANGKTPPKRDALGRPLPKPEPSADQRGYDARHRALRKSLLAALVLSGPRPCRRCDSPMDPTQKLDLGHPFAPGQDMDLEHAACNRAGRLPGRAGPERRTRKRSPGRVW